MSFAFPFPVTPRRKRAASGADLKLYDSLTTPIRLLDPQSTPDSHCVPELDWGLTPDIADHYPTTPSDKGSPSPLLGKAKEISIIPTRSLKQLRRSSRIQAREASKCAKLECSSQNPAPVFAPSVYSGLPSLPPLSAIFKGKISWENFNFYKLSRALSNNITSQSTLVAPSIPNTRRAALQDVAEPALKRIKEKAEPAEENNPPCTVMRLIAPTGAKMLETTPESLTGRQKQTNSALIGVTHKRFSRILPLDTIERIWEDKQRCVASLVTKPDARCSALAKSPKDIKKWICSQLSDPKAPSNLITCEDYIRQLVQMTTCTAHHRNIAEEQLERLLDCYHDRRSRHIASKHDFTKRDVKTVQCWLAALTSLPVKGDREAMQPHQQIQFFPRSTLPVPTVEALSDLASTCKKQLPTREPKTILLDKVLSTDAPARPQEVIETWKGAISSCKATPSQQLLSLLKIDPQRSTCIGKRKDGEPCGMPVAKASREEAIVLLREVLGFPSSSMLQRISGLLLCKRFHQSQIAVISSQWLQTCTVSYDDQKIHKKETCQAVQHRPESTLVCQKKEISKNVQMTHSLDSFRYDSENDTSTSIVATRTAGIAQKTEIAQTFDEGGQKIIETLTTTDAMRTVETRRVLTSTSQRVETGTILATRQLTKTASWFYSSPIDGVKSVQAQSKTVALRQSLLIAAQASKLDEVELVGIHQRFSWYISGGSGSASVENWLHKSLNTNLTLREYTTPLKGPDQPLKYPSQSMNYPGQGLIYMYWIPGNFGFVKIGKTSGESAEERLDKWKKQCGHKVEEYTRGEKGLALQLPHAFRVERLVHDELRQYRMKEKSCEKCGAAHNEWFAIPQYHALKVIEKWSSWIRTRPYIETNGEWHLKEPISIDDVLCKPIELPVGHIAVLPAFQVRQHAQLKTPKRTSKSRKKST